MNLLNPIFDLLNTLVNTEIANIPLHNPEGYAYVLINFLLGIFAALGNFFNAA